MRVITELMHILVQHRRPLARDAHHGLQSALHNFWVDVTAHNPPILRRLGDRWTGALRIVRRPVASDRHS